MKTNALYFPYINVPKSDWLYAMALYWDKVSSIVPHEYLHHPERLTPFMRELVQEQLVQQIIPADYVCYEMSFAEPFLKYVETRLQETPYIFNSDALQGWQKIHIEKIRGISDELQQLGVLRQADYPWCSVVPWVGTSFMAYLATCIGMCPGIDAQPVTDDEQSYQMLGGLGLIEKPRITYRRFSARHIMLEKVLPVPAGDLDIPRLVRFKERNQEQLRRFRGHIESICLDLANRPVLDEEQVQLKAQNLRDEMDDLAARIKTSWHDITFRDFLPIPSAGVTFAVANTKLALISGGLTLAASIAQFAFSARDASGLRSEPLAYAALAKKSFGIT